MTNTSVPDLSPVHLKTRWLKAYITVCQETQLDLAAAKLGLSRQTLQRQLKQLETHLQTALLVKQGKTLQPTQAGRLFLQEARELLTALQQLEQRFYIQGEKLSGQIAFAWQSASSFDFLPRTLAHFMTREPDLFVKIWCETQAEIICQHLQTGSLDLAMMDVFIESEQIVCLSTGRSPYVIVARPQALTHWSSLDYVLPQMRSPNPRQKYWDETSYPRQVLCRTDSFDALMDWCLSGRAASYLPQITVQQYLDQGDLAIVAKAPEQIYKELYLCTSLAASQKPAVQALAQALKQQMPGN